MTRPKLLRMSLLSCAITKFLGVTTCLQAEEAARRNFALLKEIVVTASKRSESLQDTAFTISAIGGGKMESLGIIGASATVTYSIPRTMGVKFDYEF